MRGCNRLPDEVRTIMRRRGRTVPSRILSEQIEKETGYQISAGAIRKWILRNVGNPAPPKIMENPDHTSDPGEWYNKPMPGPSLCWSCLNSVPNCDTGTGCIWSIAGKPVKGWEAVERRLRVQRNLYSRSYHVSGCPQYRRDEKWI